MEEKVGDQISDTESLAKKEVITSKLSNRNESRVLKNAQEKKTRNELKIADEQSDILLQKFKEQLEKLGEMLHQTFPDSTEKSVIINHFDKTSQTLQTVQNFYNESYTFFPSYHARNSQARLNELKIAIAKKREELLPKKKFAFKSKKKSTTLASLRKKPSEESKLENLTQKAASYSEDSYEIKNKRNETVTMQGEVIKGRDISITDLNDCKIILHGSPGTVHICNSNACQFEIGPVSGSVFVDRCTNCKISTGCQQLRIHHTTATQFYVHVTSRSIIEDTTNVSFGVYDVNYDGIEADFASSRLDKNTNNWKQIDDFNWLASDSVSPNWRLIDK